MSAQPRLWGTSMEWLEVRARDVVPGDLYANGATVTKVVLGPVRNNADPKAFDNVKAGDVALFCGDSFATKGKAGRSVIVGRLA